MPRKSADILVSLREFEGALYKLADALKSLEVINLRTTQIVRRVKGVDDLAVPITEETARVRIALAVAMHALQNAHRRVAGDERVDHWRDLFGPEVDVTVDPTHGSEEA